MKQFILLSLFVLMMSATMGEPVAAEGKEKQMIFRDKADVTGDGKIDEVTVSAQREEKNPFAKIIIEVEASSGEKHVIQQLGGSKPDVYLCDLTGDKLADLFISVPNKDRTNNAGTYIYSFATGSFIEWQAPEQLMIEGMLLDNYKGKIMIGKKAYKLNLTEKSAEFEEMGFYQNNGRLNEPVELNIRPVANFKPVEKKNGRFVLKENYEIYDPTDKYLLAIVETEWAFEEGTWVPDKTKLRKTYESEKIRPLSLSP